MEVEAAQDNPSPARFRNIGCNAHLSDKSSNPRKYAVAGKYAAVGDADRGIK
jgi:hypothetical protein